MAVPAEAQLRVMYQCGPKDRVEKIVKGKFKEQMTGFGIGGREMNGPVFSIFVSPNDGSWTILRRSPKYPGAVCIVASGHSWEAAKPKPKGVNH